MNLYADNFEWKNPPYEYVFDRNPFDVIAGTSKIRKMLEEKKELGDVKLSWQTDVEQFNQTREKYFLY